MATTHKHSIENALQNFSDLSLTEASINLFGTLGYQSDRFINISSTKAFCEQFDADSRFTEPHREVVEQLKSLNLLFQFTDTELSEQIELIDDTTAVDTTRIESYLFFAVELPEGAEYNRTTLSTIARAINRPLPMPALVLIRHDVSLSLAIVHRRLHKRDQSKDVLEKVTLIKDINYAEPIRAHIEILNDFSLEKLSDDYGVANFVALHEAWRKRLGSYELTNKFYQEIADWYFWAHHQVDDGTIRLPLHCDTDQEKSLFLIRLLTRVIFCWFLLEKHLIPTGLFREHTVEKLLEDFNLSTDPEHLDSAPTYYRAILQNLFFGTLNMPPEQRAFRKKKKEGQRYDKNYGITNLWRYQDSFENAEDWVKIVERIPFLNGGLFDCLDDKSGKKKDNFILDGFSDREDHGCHLPNDLFFGPERIVDLSKDYGEEKKKTARSKKAKVRGLIEILSRYKFTIEENTPLEEEIALDPELLGKVFENLLASYNEDTRTTARKALGAFYTPREIVSYMVDESLKSYLSGQVPRCKGFLDDLFSEKATLRDVRPDTREALIAAIGRVKILDPACGSGAFPMGALHRLVDLLQKLDPNNESWKRDRLADAKRYCQILREAEAPSDELKACELRALDIEKSFDTRFHALDYARKLYLIENCIYGVDIQPIATQIAKLRFFIALIVDQKVDDSAANFGVKALPNLDTRIVAADTLMPLPEVKERQGGLFDDASPEDYRRHNELKQELTRIRHDHFNARDPSKKRKLREDDERIREEMRELLETVGMPAEAARAMAKWDPYDQDAFSPFFDSEWMFGIPIGNVKVNKQSPGTLLGSLSLINEVSGQAELTESKPQEIDSGFDVVIGNPPYIRIQTLKQKDPKLVSFYKEHYAGAAKGNYDIYVVFIEAGLDVLKSDGHLAYICPHKFFNAQYGAPIRKVITNSKHLRHIVHFGEQQVFPGASIYTCLLFLSRAPSAECRFVRAGDLDEWKARLAGEEGNFSAVSIPDGEWNFTVGKGRAVFEALKLQRQTLESVTSRIFQGVKTSADKIYIVEEIERSKDKLVIHSPQTEREYEVEPDLFHPLIKGGDSRAYLLTKTDRLILFPYAKEKNNRAELIDAKRFEREYPLTWAYLLENKEYLEEREGGSFKGENWHVYGRSQALDVMPLPKVFTPDLALSASFSYDDTGEFFFTGGVAGGYGILTKEGVHPKFLTALLNSRVVDFFHHQISSQMRGGWYSYESRFIKHLPVAEANRQQVECILSCVDVLLSTRRLLADPSYTQNSRDPLLSAYLERILNGLVYELYFPEELHASGLHIFDAVGEAKLPNVETIPKQNRLAELRTKFEGLYDGKDPLRIALDRLQTLDTIRIIEGKA